MHLKIFQEKMVLRILQHRIVFLQYRVDKNFYQLLQFRESNPAGTYLVLKAPKIVFYLCQEFKKLTLC